MKDTEFKKIIKKDYNLSKHTSYKIGGKAKYFIEVQDANKIIELLDFCVNNKIKSFILGGGSNVLFSDDGFDGLVIKISNKKINFNGNIINVDAGASLQEVVKKSAQRSLSGLEYLAGIPGSVGGAVRGNAGAYGHEMSDIVESAELIIKEDGKFSIKELNKEKLKFEYRSSIIKRKEYVILRVKLKLKKSDKEKVKKIITDIIKERNSKQPYEYPSAGCVFKNIVENKNSKVKEFEVYNKVPAGKIIEELGLKGKSYGGATVSKKHSNFIINSGDAKASDVMRLIEEIKTKAKDKYGVELEEEIKIVE